MGFVGNVGATPYSIVNYTDAGTTPRSGEISTNNIDEQEISVLSLHLLQNCLVYINTLMIQNVLTESNWFNIFTNDDFSGLTPLIYSHVNPYGSFKLDMKERIAI